MKEDIRTFEEVLMATGVGENFLILDSLKVSLYAENPSGASVTVQVSFNGDDFFDYLTFTDTRFVDVLSPGIYARCAVIAPSAFDGVTVRWCATFERERRREWGEGGE